MSKEQNDQRNESVEYWRHIRDQSRAEDDRRYEEQQKTE